MIPAALLAAVLAAGPTAPIAARPDPALLGAGLPRGQHVVQTLAADLDDDGKPEWIAVGEPAPGTPGEVSIAIFRAPVAGKAPELLFAQRLVSQHLARAGAVVLDVSPIGNAVVLVGAEPSPGGDSRFVVQLFAFHKGRYKPMVPELLEVRSQGGFAIEDLEPGSPGDELVAWTYLKGEGEQLHDEHRYAHKRWRFDGLRWVADAKESRTVEKLADATAAAKGAGARSGDLRRQIPRIAEVP